MAVNFKELYVYKREEVLPTVHNKQFSYVFVGMIENYKSLIWTERFFDAGEFILELYYSQEMLDLLKVGNCLFKYDLNVVREQTFMEIEEIQITSNTEDGDILTVKGKSSNSLLSRRIVWETTRFQGKNVRDAVYELVLTNTGNSTSTAEPDHPYFEGLVQYEPTPWTVERGLSLYILIADNIETDDKITIQVTGKNLLETIKDICKDYKLGFVIKTLQYFEPMGVGEHGGIVYGHLGNPNKNILNKFQLLLPTDRSSYVIFSDEYDNISNATYARSEANLSNVALIAGKGEGDARKKFAYEKGAESVTEPSGYEIGIKFFDRKEVYLDVRDSDTTEFATDTDYGNSLIPNATQQFNNPTEAFDTELYTDGVFKYGEDFFLGDFVTIKKYHLNLKAQVTEVIESIDNEGYRVTPIFTY